MKQQAAHVRIGRHDWYLIECFRVVARLEHVTRAAKELGTSQPALSRAIASLEARLNIRLFERKGRSIALTANARTLLAVVERAHCEISRVITDLGGLTMDSRQPISVGLLHTLGGQVFPKIVAQFKRDYPDADFAFARNSSAGLEKQLAVGELDVIFTTVPPRDPTLSWKKVTEQKFVLITPRKHPLAKKKSVRLDKLSNENFVGFRKGHVLRNLIEDLCAKAGLIPQTTSQCDDLSAISGFVSEGLGIAIVPNASSWPNDVAVLTFLGPSVHRAIGIAWNTKGSLHPSARRFKDAIVRSV
jgi:DNA-binding transcriptional LysR family regulator